MTLGFIVSGCVSFERGSRRRRQFAWNANCSHALQLTATGTTNTQWRLDSSEALTGTNPWQPLTNITLGPSPTVIEQPLNSTNRFYRGTWLP